MVGWCELLVPAACLLELYTNVWAIHTLEGRSQFGSDLFVHPCVAQPFLSVGVLRLQYQDSVVWTNEVDLCECGPDLRSRGFADLF